MPGCQFGSHSADGHFEWAAWRDWSVGQLSTVYGRVYSDEGWDTAMAGQQAKVWGHPGVQKNDPCPQVKVTPQGGWQTRLGGGLWVLEGVILMLYVCWHQCLMHSFVNAGNLGSLGIVYKCKKNSKIQELVIIIFINITFSEWR